MTEVTMELLRKMCKVKPNESNMKSIVEALQLYGQQFGLMKPQRLAHFLPQLMHESGSFKYDREIWGPTPAQKRYEGRKDLGNTQKGDGKKFMGRTGIQVTGRGNVKRFTAWAKSFVKDRDVPDFTKNPELLNTDPWEGLVPIWYWEVGNPTGKSLNRYADQNNIEMITKRINGGLNGYTDRLEYYVRCALVLLGYNPKDIKGFQKDQGLAVDGIAGPMTRQSLHTALGGKNPFKEVKKVDVPVVVTMPEPVTTPELEKPAFMSKDGITQLATGPVGVTAVGILTDVPMEKLLLLIAVVTVGVIVWYALRRINRTEQKKQVAEIEGQAAVKKTQVAAARIVAEMEMEQEEKEAA